MKVILTLAREWGISVKSTALRTCLERLLKEGAISAPAEVLDPTKWEECGRALSERVMSTGKGKKDLHAWGQVRTILIRAREERATWTAAQKCLFGVCPEESAPAAHEPGKAGMGLVAERVRQLEEAMGGDRRDRVDPVAGRKGGEGAGEHAAAEKSQPQCWPLSTVPEETCHGDGVSNPTAPAVPPPSAPPPAYPWKEMRETEERFNQRVETADKGEVEPRQEGRGRRRREAAFNPDQWLPGMLIPSPQRTPETSEDEEESEEERWRSEEMGVESREDEEGGAGSLCSRLQRITLRDSDQKRETQGSKQAGTEVKTGRRGGAEEALRLLAEQLQRVREEVQKQEKLVRGRSPSKEAPVVPLTDWRLIADQCTLEGLRFQGPVAYPIRVAPGGGGREWVALDPRMVQQALKAVQEQGLRHPLTTSLLDSLHSGPLIPWDCRNLAGMLLGPMKATLWKADWTARLQGVVNAAQVNRQHPARGLTLQALKGSDPAASTPAQQVARLTTEQCNLITQASRQAFQFVAGLEAPASPWTQIKQKPGEGFLEFCDRLQAALQQAQLPEEAKVPVMMECMKQQSSEAVRRIIMTAPPGLGFSDLVTYVLDKQKHEPAQAIAVAVAQALTSNNCFGCGQPGHRRAQCPKKGMPARPTQGLRGGGLKLDSEGERDACWACGGKGHRARECPSKGNGKGNRGQRGPRLPAGLPRSPRAVGNPAPPQPAMLSPAAPVFWAQAPSGTPEPRMEQQTQGAGAREQRPGGMGPGWMWSSQ